ncbi:MAG: hypothetical protein EBU08_08160 [Micrococcales bacterium]|jgi:hypothetical protein|nr:hypothetical protein [Micrococcales bacterium]
MNVTQAIDAIYEVFGIPNNASAPEIMRRRIFNDLNSAMQLIWAKGHRFLDYYTRQTITATISANSDNVVLSDSVAAVLGPVKRVSDGIGLRPIRSRGEYDSFASIYAGSLTALTGAPPQAYFVDQERPSPDAADSTKITMFVVPSPTISTQLSVEVSVKAPTFTTSDYASSTAIPMPHNYAESLLLPIARYLSSSSLFFADKTKQREPLLKAEYDRALKTLEEAK